MMEIPNVKPSVYFREWREHKNITLDKLAELMDTTKSTLSKMQNGQMKWTTIWLGKAANALEIRVEDLFRPPGAVDELTYHPLDEHDPHWRAEPDLPAANAYSREAFTPTIAGALPEIDVRVGAGEGSVGEVLAIALGGEAISGHQIVNEWVFPEPFLRTEINATPNHTLVMAVVGDSMTPTYQPGDRVLVDLSQHELVSDTVYVISDGHSPPQIKRLQRVMFSDPVRVRIISDNPALETDTVELSRVRIIGRVVGHVARK